MLRSHLFQVNWSGVCAGIKLLLVWLFAGHNITAKQQVTCWLEDDRHSRWQRSVLNLQFLALTSDVSCSSDIPICTNYNEMSTSVFSTKKNWYSTYKCGSMIQLGFLFWKLGFYGFKWILVKVTTGCRWSCLYPVMNLNICTFVFCSFFLVGCWVSQYFGWISVDVFTKNCLSSSSLRGKRVVFFQLTTDLKTEVLI